MFYNYFSDEESWRRHFNNFCNSKYPSVIDCSSFEPILHPYLRRIFILKMKNSVTGDFLITIVFTLKGESEAAEKKRKRINDGVSL